VQLDPATAQIVSASLTRMHARSAFFTALALFARFEVSHTIPTAATDGRTIFVNPKFFDTLTTAEQDAVLVHEVLHAALLHVPRRGGRDPKLWNVAADIVVNGMLVQEHYSLPAGGLRNEQIEHLSAEEVYELLLQEQQKRPAQAEPQPSEPDLLDQAPADAQDSGEPGSEPGASPADAQGRRAELEKHWQQAHQQAKIVAESSMAGQLPAAMRRELGEIEPAQLDWRSYLWRYLVQTPTDFQHFDRRFVGRGMYLETLSGESVNVLLAVDTSGSIDQAAVRMFLGEVQGILRAYPHLRCELYYADAELYGPYPLTPSSPIPPPIGGGGTSFRPFFERLPRRRAAWEPSVAIYLTDGYGEFPERAPRCPVLWVVTPGGLDLDRFPFGQAVRLLPHASAA
jgi:predicted metal-dependent peptidase